MTLDRRTGAVGHRRVSDLPGLLRPGDLFVLNDTKVIPARIFGTDGKGRRTEFLLVERVTQEAGSSSTEEGEGERAPQGELWHCLAKPGRRVKPHRRFFFERGWEAEELVGNDSREASPLSPSKKGAATNRNSATVANSPSKLCSASEREAAGLYTLCFRKRGSKKSLLSDLPSFGSASLPPYIHRPAGEAVDHDRDDYQTVYAERPGAIAAPTAGLHFTQELLAAVAARGVEIGRVTLHVGLGTFRPVRTERVEEHAMDPERG